MECDLLACYEALLAWSAVLLDSTRTPPLEWLMQLPLHLSRWAAALAGFDRARCSLPLRSVALFVALPESRLCLLATAACAVSVPAAVAPCVPFGGGSSLRLPGHSVGSSTALMASLLCGRPADARLSSSLSVRWTRTILLVCARVVGATEDDADKKRRDAVWEVRAACHAAVRFGCRVFPTMTRFWCTQVAAARSAGILCRTALAPPPPRSIAFAEDALTSKTALFRASLLAAVGEFVRRLPSDALRIPPAVYDTLEVAGFVAGLLSNGGGNRGGSLVLSEGTGTDGSNGTPAAEVPRVFVGSLQPVLDASDSTSFVSVWNAWAERANVPQTRASPLVTHRLPWYHPGWAALHVGASALVHQLSGWLHSFVEAYPGNTRAFYSAVPVANDALQCLGLLFDLPLYRRGGNDNGGRTPVPQPVAPSPSYPSDLLHSIVSVQVAVAILVDKILAETDRIVGAALATYVRAPDGSVESPAFMAALCTALQPLLAVSSSLALPNHALVGTLLDRTVDTFVRRLRAAANNAQPGLRAQGVADVAALSRFLSLHPRLPAATAARLVSICNLGS